MAAGANASRAANGADISWIRLSAIELPLDHAISDAKVLTGRQTPLTSVAMLCAEIQTRDGN